MRDEGGRLKAEGCPQRERFVVLRALVALVMLVCVFPVWMAVELPGMVRAWRRGKRVARAEGGMLKAEGGRDVIPSYGKKARGAVVVALALWCVGCASSPTRGMSEDKKLIHGGYGAAWDVPVEMIEVPK